MSTKGAVNVSGRVPLTALLGLLRVGTVATMMPACAPGDECSERESQCHDNVLWTCHRSNEDFPRWVWGHQDCGADFCRPTGGGTAICATEPTSNPACLGNTVASSNDVSCTADGRLVQCNGGYVETVLDTCDRPELCIPLAGACALSATIDSRCQSTTGVSANTQLDLCDSQHLLSCSAGYLIGDRDCGPGTCYRAEPEFRIECVLSATPDPRCVALPDDPVRHGKQGCDGDLQFTCYDNYIETVEMCAVGRCLVAGPSFAYCDVIGSVPSISTTP
jgi:hypothetical protein